MYPFVEVNMIYPSTLLLLLISSCFSFDFEGSSSSFVKLSAWSPCQNGTIAFELKTQLPNALLLYTDTGENGDYYQLKLVNGVMHLQFKLDRDGSALTAGQNLNDNEWHEVAIIREGQLTTLKVDEVSYTRELKLYNPKEENSHSSDNYVFIGGLPKEYNDKLSELKLPTVIFEPRLRGSVRNIVYSNCGGQMTIPEVLDSHGIILENDQCMLDNPCQNGGICVTRDSGVLCDCYGTRYEGEVCEIEKQPTEAMFKGTQYLTYDLSLHGDPISSRNDRLSLHFRTRQSNGLLFYTGKDKDYMTVSLKGGAIHIAVELGSGTFKKVVDLGGYTLDDNQWHHLVIQRVAREITVEIDGTERASGTTMGDFNMLSSSVVYVGGSPVQLKGSEVRSNFKGCMKQVEYTADSVALDLTELAERRHSLMAVVGDVEFGRCEDIQESVPVTFATPEAFVALPRWDVRKNSGTITFQFQTTESNGLLMYNSGNYGTTNMDFFALEILDGYFYLILDLGTGPTKQKASRTRVDDGDSHIVFFQYSGRTGYINIDGHRTEYMTPGQGSQLDLEELLFIGGVDFNRHNSYRLPKEVWSGMLGYGYVGCLFDLVINEIRIDLMTTARKQLQRDIVGHCRATAPLCPSLPCRHKGLCMEGWNRFICDCRSTPYMGDTCQEIPATLLFDGAQYVVVTMPEESHTEAEDISLRFRTIRSNGVLLMTSSSHSSDTLELYLEGGKCKLTVDLGSGSKTLTIGHALNDDRWHTVYVKRRGQSMELRVDGNRPVTDNFQASNTILNFDDIDIGSQIQQDASVRHHSGFVGAMQSFVFNNNRFFDIAKDQNIENIEVTARFDNGESVTRDPVTFRSMAAHVILPQLQANKHLAVYFKFKTLEETGLILYNGRIGNDFLALELYQGYMYYIYDMGGGAQRIRVNTQEPLNDNKWHDVSLLRPQVEQQLIRVDDNPSTVENMEDYSARRFDLKGPLYFGGVKKALYNSLPMQILSKHGFLGCIASLDLNGYMYNILRDATSVEHSVIEGCSGTEVACQNTSCFNGGRCVQQWNSYTCDCEMTSFTGPVCTEESTTYKFGIDRGLIVFEHRAGHRPSTSSDYLALGFRTIQPFAVLVRVDSVANNDYIEMQLVEGNILVVYNMGQVEHPIGEAFHKMNDGKYHVVRFVRSRMNATIQVDNLAKTTKNPRGKQMFIFNNQSRVVIGGRKDESGNINRAFVGTISGLVFNGDHLLDMLRDGDPRMTVEGDVTRVLPDMSKLQPEMQSTEEMKTLKRSKEGYNSKRKIRSVNSTKKKPALVHGTDVHRRHHVYRNQIASKTTLPKPPPKLKKDNSISQLKLLRKRGKFIGTTNGAKARIDYVMDYDITTPSSTPVPKDHILTAEESEYSSGYGPITSFPLSNHDTEIDMETFDADQEPTDYLSDGSGFGYEDQNPLNFRSSLNSLKTSSGISWTGLGALLLGEPSGEGNQRSRQNEQISIGKVNGSPIAADVRSYAIYPKDRGKHSRRRKAMRKKNRQTSFRTTPKQQGTDDIIFSGVGPGCYSTDDEDECTTTSTTAETSDDIILSTVVITRAPTKEPEVVDSPVSENVTCEHCPQGTEVFPGTGASTHTYVNGQTPRGQTSPPDITKEQKEGKKKGHLNIILIIGIAAGVLLALIILVVVLYKCRSREEGSYRVDESQNFAYLETKKQQTNGNVVNSTGNGKAGKKKDVKEWYV